MTNFADTLPDLTQSPVPYPEPKTAGEVCANRLAVMKSGAVKRHYFPLVAPDQKAWTDLQERVANLENGRGSAMQELIDEDSPLRKEVAIMSRALVEYGLPKYPADPSSGSTVSQP